MKSFHRFFKIFILLFSVLLASACMHKSNTLSKKTGLQAKDFYFTQTADLPINYNASYFIEFYNWSDHTISLANKDFIVDNVNLKNGYSPSDIIDVSQCQKVPANSSCHILLKTYNKLNSDEGSFSIAVNKGEVKAITIVKYFTSHKDSDFDMQFGAANTTFNFNRDQSISVNIPIVFNEDFYDIKVNHDHQINYQFLNCDASHFIKNTVCILQINSRGGKQFSSMIKITGKHGEGDSANQIILETPIVNSMSNFGNLLFGLSANSVVANGTNTVTLSLANNGLGTISSLVPSIVNVGSPLSITSNSCTGGSIASNGSCSIVITTDNSTVWNVDGITLAYSDGLNSNTVTIPIVVKPNTGAYGALNLTVFGNMVTTKINTSSMVTIIVANPGSLTVNNIIVSKLNIPASVTQYQNTCSNSLAAGTSCKYVFQYSPTSATSVNSFSFVINGNYTFAGSPVTISNLQHVSYSATNGGGYLNFSISTMLYNPNFGTSVTQTVIVTNAGGASVSGVSADFSSTAFPSEYSVVAASTDYSSYQNCTTMSGILAVGEKCVIAIQFNPQTVYFDAAVFELDYTINGGSTNADFLAYQSNVVNSAVNIVVTKSVSGASGSGTIGYPYTVNTVNGNDFTVTYTYTNTGSMDATYFAVSPTPSVYYNITGTGSYPCPTSATITLAAGAYCQLQVQGLNPNLYNVAQVAGAYNLHTPGVSFRDSSNSIIKLNNFGDINVNFVAFYTAQITPTTTFDISTGMITSKMTATILSASSSVSLSFIAYSPSDSGGSVTYTNDGSSASASNCTLTSMVGANCYVNATYATLATNDDALFQMTPTSGGLVSWMAVPNISALAYFYTQGGTKLTAWKLNTDYSFTQLGSSLSSTGNSPAIIYNNQLLLFTSESQIKSYPINNNGSLGAATTVTVSPAFSAIPARVTVSQFNGKLYVAVLNNPGASANIVTYACGIISEGSISCTSSTSSESYNATKIFGMTSGYNTTANTLYYSIGQSNSTSMRMLYSVNDGTTLNSTGPSLQPFVISTSNYQLDPTLFFGGGNSYFNLAGYNADGTVNTTSTTAIRFSHASSSFFVLEAAMNYVLPTPVLLVANGSNLYFKALDDSATSPVLAGANATVYVPLMP